MKRTNMHSGSLWTLSSVREAKESPSGKGTMVAVYGTFPFLLMLLSIYRSFAVPSVCVL